ncbi:MAG: DUF1080 domain-containing protein [Gemmataceae bacterium]|nr:DUF1080 domain-containing protein [Gemmataceae bacterium]MCI0740078.1 DUF1080 domain-containing protein [Gemmataceae bacterium]
MRVLALGILWAVPAAFFLSSVGSAGDDFKPEPGFVLLFNGKNLDGWKTKKGDSLEGKTEAFGGRFKVEKNVLVIDPKVKGDVIITTAKEFAKDVHIKFEFLPGPACNNDLFFRGNKFDITLKLKGVKDGEWNELDIVAQGDKVEFKVNGQALKAAANKGATNALGIRAEFGSMQIRRLRAKE